MKITEFRGISNLVVAEVLKDTSEEILFGPVEPLAGVAELSKEVESSSESHYYDNQPAVVINSVGPDTVTITSSVLSMAMRAKITGSHYDQEKGMLIEGSEKNKYFAIGYKTKLTDGSTRYVWRLKGTFAVPSSTHQTESNGTDANGQELVYTGIKTEHKFSSNLDDNGNPDGAKAIVVDGSKTNDASFFVSVFTPDTFTPVPRTTFTITYNGNGKTEGDVPSTQTVPQGESVNAADGAGLKKDDEEFSSWNTESDGTGTSYAVGASITPTGNMTLYAIFVAG